MTAADIITLRMTLWQSTTAATSNKRKNNTERTVLFKSALLFADAQKFAPKKDIGAL